MSKNMIKILIELIEELSVDELIEFNKRLRELETPPQEYSNVPVKPKPNPPQLTDAIGQTLDGKPLIKRP